MIEKILVAGNKGPCGGVNMSLEAADQVLDFVSGREPVYTNWDIVNNKPIMDELTAKGLINVKNNFDLIPNNSILFFSAHGVEPRTHQIAKEKNLLVIDVTCPLVERVHNLAIKAKNNNKHIIYIGVNNHPETMGVIGEVSPEDVTLVESINDVDHLNLPTDKPNVVYSQTTLLPDEVEEIEARLQEKSSQIEIPNRLDICYAMFNRQAAVEALIPEIDLLLVVGSKHSHNSQELRKKGEKVNLPAYSIDTKEEINQFWFTEDIKTIGLTAGASVLDRFTDSVIDWFVEQNPGVLVDFQPQVIEERQMTFRLPQKDIDALRRRYL